MVRIEAIGRCNRFDSDYKKLSVDLKKATSDILELLFEHPLPSKLRFKKLSGCRNPSIYTIHVTSNHSHKISLELKGSTALLRRIGTHKEIDRTP